MPSDTESEVSQPHNSDAQGGEYPLRKLRRHLTIACLLVGTKPSSRRGKSTKGRVPKKTSSSSSGRRADVAFWKCRTGAQASALRTFVNINKPVIPVSASVNQYVVKLVTALDQYESEITSALTSLNQEREHPSNSAFIDDSITSIVQRCNLAGQREVTTGFLVMVNYMQLTCKVNA